MSEPMTEGAERRGDPRFTLLRRLELRDGEDGTVIGRVVDVGARGLRVVGPHPFAPGTEIEVTMQLGRPVRLRLLAIWSEAGSGLAEYHTGCRLIEPLEGLKTIGDLVRRLRRFLADQLP